ncbi:MAG TPA: YidC/Oxa1 family membrane protein insertase [Candidatus Paceibacterota bacterium]|nr:YidC/Oxa1 family membrane protein insertase [Candidatus Paceibacterota bacterium]
MIDFFHTVLYVPIYNLLIFLTDVLPGGDIGLAVVIATIIVKFAIMPLSLAALRTQRAMKLMEPELKALREKYKDKQEEQAREMFALYKRYGVNPFAGILTLFIQLPIIITLFWVFQSKTLLTVDTSLLYSFVPSPEMISPAFLGIFLVTGTSITLAAVAGVTQFLQARYAIPIPAKAEKPSMSADMGRAMAFQMRYLLPVFMAAISYTSVALALYFITTNIVGLAQEYYVRKTERKPQTA